MKRIFLITLAIAISFSIVATAQEELKNLALKKPVWMSGGAGQGGPELITDGITKTDPYLGGPGEVEIDFEDVVQINTVKIWQYWGDGRTYFNRKIAFDLDSAQKGGFDGKEIIVFNTIKEEDGKDQDLPETEEGRTITFDTIEAEFLHAWVGANSVNQWSHWVEIQAFFDPELMPVDPKRKLATSWGSLKRGKW